MLYTHKIIDESMYNKIEEVKNYVMYSNMKIDLLDILQTGLKKLKE
jgi:hypothetical protein